jgi:carbonic anhydrase
MSDTMLLGVLRMPIHCWIDSELDQRQRHSRYLEAADRIESDEAKILEQQAVIQQLSENKTVQWTKQRPTVPGFYWVYQHKTQRVVNVWNLQGRLLTNEDGGVPIEDNLYAGSYWYGPIQAPEFRL